MLASVTLLRLFALALPLSAVRAVLPDGRLNANQHPSPVVPKVSIPDGPVTDQTGATIPPYNTTYYFDQLVDHNKPSLGTFKQRYWHTWEYYKPGGPIILSTPGEGNADGYSGYLTNRTINGLIAQQQNGATIVLEHRFYGFSNPYPDLTVASLRVHTLQQAIEDLEYFAKNVKLPMPSGDQVPPGKAPWILIGGSYAGALTSWTMVNKPGLFWAGYSSSGVVQAITDYWGYFEPIRQFMPKNCSSDVQAVVAHFDKVFTSRNTKDINALKDQFGMSTVNHLDDAAGALRNNLWDWQGLQVTSGPGTAFYKFCDALEVSNGQVASASGFGLDHALQAWGSYFKNSYIPEICGDSSANDCLGTYDTTQAYWNNTAINNSYRSWFWIVCNEVGYLQDGPPRNVPAIVTRLVQPAYDLRQCQQMFPAAFKHLPVVRADETNRKYQGWNVHTDRLFFANGQRDPWREATVSADGLNIQSTPSQPIAVGDGFHCSDLSAKSAVADATIQAVHTSALASMKTWLTTWKPSGDHQHHGRAIEVKEKPVSAWLKGVGTFD